MAYKEDESKKNSFALTAENYKLMAIGFVAIVIGFILMTGGGTDDYSVFNGEELFSFRRTVIAPIIIVAGFVFELYAIMKKPSTKA